MPFIHEITRYATGVAPLPSATQIFTSSSAEPPSGDGPYVHFIETGGISPARVQNRLVGYERPSAEIIVRAKKFSVAMQMARALFNRLNIRNLNAVGAYSVSVTLTRSGSVATATSPSHGFVQGQIITIAGAVEPEYNVIDVPITFIDTNTFSFAVAGTPASPATGAITASFAGTRYVELEPMMQPYDGGPDANGRARVRFSVRAYKGQS
jgi:hypothetical protein